MKATSFPNAPKVQKAAKSKIINGRCAHTDKIPMYKKRAERLAERLTPDERGNWSAYKCPYGKSHWHIGHTPTNLTEELKDK